MPLRPTASTPPTVAPATPAAPPSGPRSASAAWSSATGVPAPQRTTISSGSTASTPAGARTSRASASTAPPTSHCVRPPTQVTGPAGPTSAAKAVRSTRRPARAAPRRTGCHAGSTLCGLATPSGSKARRRRVLGGEVGLGEHERHVVPLLDADAVLARQHPAGGHAGPHDLLARGQHVLHHPRLALVEHQQRVQVPVAGVEDVHHQQVVARGDLVHLAEHLHEPPSGHDGVVQVVVGLDPGDGAEGVLAALPDEGPLGLVGGHPHRARPVGQADLGHALHRILDAGLQAVDLDDEDGRGVGGEAGVDEGLHRPGDEGVHHLDRRGHDARPRSSRSPSPPRRRRRRSRGASCGPSAGWA